jgi:hypothetical protein
MNLVIQHPRVRRQARTVLLALTAVLLAAPSLGAQLIRVPRPDESRRAITVAADIGLLFSAGRYDAVEARYWSLGDALVYRGAVDIALSAGSLGLAASLATVPIARSGIVGSDGDIQYRQFVATFRSPESRSFHQLIELSAGLAQWASYSGTDVLTAGERKTRNGAFLAFGYGFAFPIGSRATFTFVQDAGIVIGSSKDLPASESRTQRQYATRLGLRVRAGGSR